MLTPIILGADKTTVSVATGNQEFHPLYMSLGNIHNDMRRAHRESVVPIAFLAIPKGLSGRSTSALLQTNLLHTAEHEWQNDDEFRVFKKADISRFTRQDPRTATCRDVNTSRYVMSGWALSPRDI